jgi:hypothetical protein
MWYIYSLAHPLTEIVFYVGKTTDAKTRFITHINAPNNKYAKDKKYIAILKEISDIKLIPIFKVHASTSIRSQSHALEKHWIRHFQKISPILCNIQLTQRPPSKRSSPYEDLSRQSTTIEQDAIISSKRTPADLIELSRLTGLSKCRILSFIVQGSYPPALFNRILKYYKIDR